MMSKQQVREQRLREVTSMVGTLAERMMSAYVVGSRPGEAEVKAFCRAVLLLEEYAVPLPLFTEDVIGRLTKQDQAGDTAPAARPRPEPEQVEPRLTRMLSPLKSLWAGYAAALPAAISAKA